MKEKNKKLSAEELLKWARKKKKEKELLVWAIHTRARAEQAIRELSEKGLLDEIIGVSEEILKDMEGALRRNVEYPSNELRYQSVLTSMKGKEGWFYNLFRKYIKHKLKESINKPPKQLSKVARECLEKEVETRKMDVAFLKKHKTK